ncbi:MAG: hypothetical protein IT379_33035 [Deltaproteobacteria bacterium]|nr:hypothetical protein [Deltaproteobacteria bacterium]
MGRTRNLGFGLGMLLISAGLAFPTGAWASEERMSFCGGGEEEEDLGADQLYEVEQKIEIGELRQARRMVVAGLRRGTFRRHVRGLALGAWAETELRLGQYRRAAGLYRRAIRAQSASETDPLRVGLAVALYRGRRSSEGRRVAERFVGAACPDNGVTEDQVACYGARLVLAMTAPTPESRSAGMEAADAVRASEPRLESSFAEMRAMFPAPPTTTVAAADPVAPADTPSAAGAAASSARTDAPRAAVAAR